MVLLLVLLYAAFAGLRTVGDMDLGWQLATGRWIVQHHTIPSTDVLSYTARSQAWIYPALSQVLLYCLFLLGGYSLLSWIGAATCVGTVAILTRRGGTVAAFLAVIAVPMIASRTQPRAEMFTEILFTAFVSILWFYYRSGSGPIWLLPILMLFWVNLHLGFIAGLAMCGAYICLELDEVFFRGTRHLALERLRRASPWLGLTVLATLLNPWGARIYLAVARQNEILRIHSRWIEEWSRVRLTSSTLLGFFSWRDPHSALFWLLAAAVLAVLLAAYRRRFAHALVLAASIYALLHAVRFQGPFASVVVIIGGSIIADTIAELVQKHELSQRKIRVTAGAFVLVVAAFVAVRVTDLVSNRYYLRTPATFSVFGPGESPLFPERAAEFLLKNQLPANILNDYNAGGFITWALSPQYADYIDGRAIPFGAELFVHLEKLLAESPDSPDWQREAEQRGINTIILSVDHELAGGLASLDRFCASQAWRVVFLDTYGAVFLRDTPETASLLSRLPRLDCATVQFDAPPSGDGSRVRAERFRYDLNAAAILVVLDRNLEALQKLEKAELLFSDSPFLHYAKGSALQNLDHPHEAEKEFLRAIDLGSDDAAYGLARLYDEQSHYAQEADILTEAASRSAKPYGLYLRLGYAQLAMGHPREALDSFNRAEETNPFVYEADELGEVFRAQIAEGRRRAQQMLTAK